jgi:hypothetical protein
MNDPKLGRIRVRLWRNKHFQAAAEYPMQLLRVERLEERCCGRISRPLWLAWLGEELPNVTEVWSLYLRRFTLDHWYRESQAASALDTASIKYSQTM